jgi:hypothetical protein
MEIGAAGGVLRMSPLPYCQAKDCQDASVLHTGKKLACACRYITVKGWFYEIRKKETFRSGER